MLKQVLHLTTLKLLFQNLKMDLSSLANSVWYYGTYIYFLPNNDFFLICAELDKAIKPV